MSERDPIVSDGAVEAAARYVYETTHPARLIIEWSGLDEPAKRSYRAGAEGILRIAAPIILADNR